MRLYLMPLLESVLFRDFPVHFFKWKCSASKTVVWGSKWNCRVDSLDLPACSFYVGLRTILQFPHNKTIKTVSQLLNIKGIIKIKKSSKILLTWVVSWILTSSSMRCLFPFLWIWGSVWKKLGKRCFRTPSPSFLFYFSPWHNPLE